MSASIGEQDDFSLDWLRIKNGFSRPNQHETLGITKGKFSDAFPVVAHGVFDAIEKYLVSALAQSCSKVDGVGAAAVPVVGDKKVVPPKPISYPLPPSLSGDRFASDAILG